MNANVATAPNIWEKTKLFLSQVRTEMQKVSWPSQEQTKTYTTVVLVASILTGVIIASWDFVLSEIVKILFVG